MTNNIFEILGKLAETGKLVDEAEETKKADFSKLRQHYGTGRDQSYKKPDGTKVHQYRHGIMTDIGDIEATEWISLANELIDKYNERDIFNELYEKYIFKNNSPKWVDFNLINALSLHMSRIFENPEWVCYEKFKTQFLDKRNKV